MLGLVGELSALSGSAIRDALASPDAPLARRHRGDPRRARRRPRLRLAAGRGPADPDRVRRRVRAGARQAPEHVRRPRRRARRTRRAWSSSDPADHLSATNQSGLEVACAIPGDAEPWGVLLLVWGRPDPLDRVGAGADPGRRDVASGNIVRAASSAADVAHQLQRADALRRVTGDIGSRLDLDEILDRLADHVQVLFAADRVAAFLFEEDGTRRMAASRGLSQLLDRRGHERRGRDPRRRRRSPRAGRCSRSTTATTRASGNLRAAVVQEGFDTACIAPLLDGDNPEPLGILGVVPRRAAPLDRRRARDDGRARDPGDGRDQGRPELRPAGDVGGPAPVDPAARRAAQPPDERQGDRRGDRHRAPPAHRLPQRARLPAVRRGPAARSPCRAASASTSTRRPEQLKVQYGAGITGWVAEHRVAQRLDDAAADARAQTIAGHRGRPRRVDAPRADAVRGRGPRRARALEARPPPVPRRRPAAARDLRQLRGAGDGQRRRDRSASASSRPRSSRRSAASASSSRSPSRSSPRSTRRSCSARSPTASAS